MSGAPGATGAGGPEAEAPASYRFGPRDQRGLLAGVRAGQVVLLVGSLVSSVAVARLVGGGASIPIAALVAIVGGLAGFVPFGGRTADEWLPLVAGHALATVAGAWARPPEAGAAPGRRPVPRAFRGLRLVAVELPGRAPFGAVWDRGAGTLTGVLAVAGGGFGLLEPAEQERHVAAWSAVLASLAGGEPAILRLQWLERTVPAGPLPRPAGLALPEPGGPARSYRALLRAEPGRLGHELLLAASVRAPRCWASGRAGAHTARGVAVAAQARAAGSVLARELAGLERRLGEAGIATVEGALSTCALGAALRRGFEPGPLQGPPPRRPWPNGCEVRWSSARVGGVVQRAYWIAEWPRSGVRADFLLPLLLPATCRRTLSLVMAPVATHAAVRAAEHARTAGAADAELRARHGFAQSARTHGQQEAVLRREAELAAGHAAYRFSGYVAVSAPDEAALGQACARVEQAAALARLALRRLDGRQAAALGVCLPLGRGCA